MNNLSKNLNASTRKFTGRRVIYSLHMPGPSPMATTANRVQRDCPGTLPRRSDGKGKRPLFQMTTN